MGTRINTNTLAMNAARYGQMNDAKVASSIEKLSSGLRINRAADDAAGLVISESLRSQVSGLDQAIRNSNEAANMVKTAEGAMGEVHDLLRSMRTLAVHASNTGANDNAAIAADQAQIANAVKSLDRISANTSFGSLKLLDGSASTKVTTNTAGLTATASGATVRGAYNVNVTGGVKGADVGATTLNYGKATGTGAGTVSTASPLAAGATVTFSDAGSTLGINETVVVDLAGATSLQDVADKINNNATASKYVKASLNASGYLTLDSSAATTAAGAAQFTTTFSSAGVATAVGMASATPAAAATVAMGDKKVMSDIQYSVASMGRDGVMGAAKTFAIAKGTNLSDVFSNFATFAKANGVEASLSLNSAGRIALTNNDVGTNRGVKITTSSTDVLAAGAVDTTGGGATVGTNMAVTVNGQSVAASDIDGSHVAISAASGPNLKNAAGLAFTAVNATSSTASDGSLTVSGGALNFQLGANAGEQSEVQLESTESGTLGKGAVAGKTVKDIDVMTFEGAQNALKIIDQAINDVSSQRAKLGAFQSQVLESNARSLSVAKENLTASESTIRDTDMAAEMVSFTKNNILSQASQAMLSQANNSSQGILQLLRG